MSRRVHYEARSKNRRGNLPLAGTLAIVGRPNVGKSTLFNRLVGSRRAIVGDEPGITRDRLYGEAEWAGKLMRVVDTGGIVPDDTALIPSEIFRQARVALEEADAIVMVVDGRTELAAPDLELARLLQRLGKPLILAVNKMDTPQLEPYAQEFRRLGLKDLVPVSAETGNGVAELLEQIYSVLPNGGPVTEAEAAAIAEQEQVEADIKAAAAVEGDEEESAPAETKVAIIGRPNVGKSTLLNALTGTGRAIVSPIAGTTRDAVDELVQRDGQTYRFIDTAGIRRKGKTELMAEKLSVVMARKHLEAADVALDRHRRRRRRYRQRCDYRWIRARSWAFRHHRHQQVGLGDLGAHRRQTSRRSSHLRAASAQAPEVSKLCAARVRLGRDRQERAQAVLDS